MSCAMWVVFPPGAAHMSRILSPGWAKKTKFTGKKLEFSSTQTSECHHRQKRSSSLQHILRVVIWDIFEKTFATFPITCPAKYSGVAPIGTDDSNTCNPTLDQSPMGSKFTPREIKDWNNEIKKKKKKKKKKPFSFQTCARSLLRTFRVLQRIVTGRGVSFASKNSIASGGENRRRIWLIINLLYP